MKDVTLASEQATALFQRLKQTVGADVAMFIVCAVENVPYRPEIQAGNWDTYYKKARENNKGFADGCIDVRAALDEGQADMDRWMREWGSGDEDKPYTVEDYRRLDEIFRTLTERQKGAGGYDAQQEYALRDCAKMSLIREYYLLRAAKGGKDSKDHISMAKTLLDMIDARLKAESLRKADEKPITTPKIDGLVEAMYKKYGLSMTMTKDEVCEALVRWLNRKGIYAHTQDAAEKAIYAIAQTTRANSDLPPLEEMPEVMHLDDFSDEFAEEQAPEEQHVYKYLGVVPREIPNRNR